MVSTLASAKQAEGAYYSGHTGYQSGGHGEWGWDEDGNYTKLGGKGKKGGQGGGSYGWWRE